MRPLLLALVLVVAGCGGSGAPPERPTVVPAELTRDLPCGHGFWVTDADETVLLELAYQGAEEPLATPLDLALPHPEWSAEVELGRDLAANWCDDVIEPDEPTPEVHERWPVTAGRLRVDGPVSEGMCAGQAVTAQATGLVAESSRGPVEIGDLVLTNTAWGCFAG